MYGLKAYVKRKILLEINYAILKEKGNIHISKNTKNVLP